MGGTLKVLGVSDLDHVDSADWYYTTDYELGNLISRQLLTYAPNEQTHTYGTTPVPDAANLPVISNGGKTYTFTIKTGVKWDTTPARQVTAADFARGIGRVCNPVAPFGSSSYVTNTIVGFKAFCDGELKIGTSASALKNYLAQHLKNVTGMVANGQTLTFHLLAPANDFSNILALPFASAVPVEYLKYAPDSAQLGKNLISDGPYKITSYVRHKSIQLVRNTAWDRSTDATRPAYVDNIDITEGLQQAAVQQQIQAGTADMEWDTFPLPTQVPSLQKTGNPGLAINPTSSSNPYLVFNTVSPNANGAMGKIPVRQAIEEGVNTTNLIQVLGGPILNTPLHQVLPAVINGGQSQYQFNMYPYNPTKAKADLAKAGYPNGLTIKLLYRNQSAGSTAIFQTLQADLPKMGIHVTGVPVDDADFYGKYLQVTPNITQKGVWDIALAGWGADWDGNSARSFMFPLFDGRTFSPSSSNFGDFNDPKVNKLDDQAVAASNPTAAAVIWHKADLQIMKDAAFIPITNPKTANFYNASKLTNFIYFDNFQNGSLTSIYFK
jgi:peptide/nickel transport system substrate-binding protein